MSSQTNPQDDQAHDKAFVRTFGMVLAALFFIFGFCIFAASLIVPDAGKSEAEMARMEQRIQPVGKVITDPALLVKVSTVKRDPLTAEQINAQVCGGCHNAGVLGAPKTGDKGAWAARAGARGGLDGLTASAIKGINAMPARGGNPDLTDEEVKAAVKLILDQSGV